MPRVVGLQVSRAGELPESVWGRILDRTVVWVWDDESAAGKRAGQGRRCHWFLDGRESFFTLCTLPRLWVPLSVLWQSTVRMYWFFLWLLIILLVITEVFVSVDLWIYWYVIIGEGWSVWGWQIPLVSCKLFISHLRKIWWPSNQLNEGRGSLNGWNEELSYLNPRG